MEINERIIIKRLLVKRQLVPMQAVFVLQSKLTFYPEQLLFPPPPVKFNLLFKPCKNSPGQILPLRVFAMKITALTVK